MKVDKFKRQATLRVSTGGKLDVNFFLSYSTDEHSGRELILDILNSERSFISSNLFPPNSKAKERDDRGST